MAVSDGFVGTDNGIGQGLSYVLPDGHSQHYALQLALDQGKAQAAGAAAALKAKADDNKQVQGQFAAQKLPDMWSPYNAAVSDANTAWQTKAANFHTTTGKSPFTDPALMGEYNKNVKGLAVQSKDFGERYSKAYGTAVSDGGNIYTPESVQNVINHQDYIKAHPMEALNEPIPQLVRKGASFDDLSKEIKPVPKETNDGYNQTTVPDRASHIDQAAAVALNNPDKWGPLLSKQFGVDITKPTYPVVGNNGRKVYSTNPATLEVLADKVLAAPDAPQQLAQFGIQPDDPYVKDKMMDVIKQQNAGFGKYLTQSADQADAKIGTKSNVSFEADNHARAIRGEQREITRFNERDKAPGTHDVGEAQSISIPYDNGKANVEMHQYVPISISKKNFAGSPYIDMATGKEGGKLASSNDYEVVGVANAPIIKSGDLKGAIAQPDYANNRGKDNVDYKPMVHVQIPGKGDYGKDKDYLVPYDRLPENVKNSKPVKAALAKFKPADGTNDTQTSSATSQPSQSKAKIVSQSTLDGLIGKKGYEGYSKKELADYYKAQGYTIQ